MTAPLHPVPLFGVKKSFDFMSLMEAYAACSSELIGQKQGDCGLFSLWFATMLLRKMSPAGRKVVFPRKLHIAPPTTGWDSTGESMRQYAKFEHRSAQGEILSAAEMQDVIKHFGYASHACGVADESSKQQFIRQSLALRRPVLVAYVFSGDMPVFKDKGTKIWDDTKDDSGPHWSLIIGEESGNMYKVIEPNAPNPLKVWDRDRLLKANGCCDDPDVGFVRYWGKDPRLAGTGFHGLFAVGDKNAPATVDSPTVDPTTGKYSRRVVRVKVQPDYDVFPQVPMKVEGTSKLTVSRKRAQKLDDVLIAVY
ncbi:MAG TPA: hypothetical protein VGM82_03590 [Gemmatimonadaceae bacterium]|jgi:hypothetical protein